jgi:hypothetical protein
LGRYDTPWFGGTPGLSQGLTNLIWMQSGWLGGGASEGIAPVLTWKAPSSGYYTLSGQFVSGDQSANSAAVAIVDSEGGTNLARTILTNNAVQSFNFTAYYSSNAVVQFQVGNNFSTGNAVGLQLGVTAVPEPSTIVAAIGLLGLMLWPARRYLWRHAEKKTF